MAVAVPPRLGRVIIRCSVQHHYFFSYFQQFDDGGRDSSPPVYVAGILEAVTPGCLNLSLFTSTRNKHLWKCIYPGWAPERHHVLRSWKQPIRQNLSFSINHTNSLFQTGLMPGMFPSHAFIILNILSLSCKNHWFLNTLIKCSLMVLENSPTSLADEDCEMWLKALKQARKWTFSLRLNLFLYLFSSLDSG